MTLRTSRFAAAAALLAATSLVATPASAADFETQRASNAKTYDTGWSSADEVYQDRRYRRHRHRGGVSVGDVLVGALIIGAIASAVDSSNDRDERYRDRDYRDRDYRDSRDNNARGLDRAAQMCVREIEQDARVESVDSVNRTADGWDVSGRLYNGDGFSCSIGNDGRIDSIDTGAGEFEASSAAPAQDNQWDDDRYARARMESDQQPEQTAAYDAPDGPQPAYPGGPVPGDDGRYDMDESGS